MKKALLGGKSSTTKMLLIIICILYIYFLFIDFSIIGDFIPSSTFKFISIVLCFFISLMTGRKHLGKTDILLLQVGLFITVIADFFLLFTDYFVIGVGVFSLVQIIYAVRYERNKIKPALIRSIIILMIILAIYLIINFYIVKIELLYLMALYYAITLIINVVKSIKSCKNGLFPYPNKYFIAIGMVLFLLCDMFVGIYNITSQMNISSGIDLLSNFSGKLVWFFYLPSQVLLSLSGVKNEAG